MISKIDKLPDGTIKLTITIPLKRIEKLYQKKLTALAKEVEVRGFRKGQAPKKLVEENIDQTKVNEKD
jgi:FKBP-type peptidyl-prolyl cis-trans isomerase (trigger factor)